MATTTRSAAAKAAPSKSSSKINVTLLNNDGSGFSEKHAVKKGTTIAAFLEERDIESERYVIRIRPAKGDRFTPTSDYKLSEGDHITAVPSKAEGAR